MLRNKDFVYPIREVFSLRHRALEPLPNRRLTPFPAPLLTSAYRHVFFEVSESHL